MKELKQATLKEKKSLVLIVFLSLLLGAAVIGQAYLITAIVEDVFLNEQSYSVVFQAIIVLLLVLGIRTISTYYSSRIGVGLATKVKKQLRRQLVNTFSVHPLQHVIQGQSGNKVSVMMDVVDEMDGYFSQYIPQVIQSTVVPLFVLVTIFTVHVNSGLILIVTAPFIPVCMAVIGMQTQKKSEERLDKLSAFSGKFLDILQGLVTLKLYGKAKQQKDEIEKSSIGFRDTTMEILKVAFTMSFLTEIISMLSIGIVALGIAIQLIVYQNLSFFTAFFVLLLVPEFFTSLKQLNNSFHNGRSSMGAARKVFDELAASTDRVAWGDKLIKNKHTPPVIELSGVSFSYQQDKLVLQELSEKFQPYSRIAIIGKSGAGKSTILHLLAGLLTPTHGAILVNGTRLPELSEHVWLNQLCYISQDPFIFSGTIQENIAIGTGEVFAETELHTVAEQAGLTALIEQLDQGYDTVIGEGGRGLSAGEKQRIAIARAFLKKPQVVLLDEPTTGLDLRTEQILQNSIDMLAKQATIITVAHRLHTIKQADAILFMQDGRIVATGTHENLIESVSAYREMVMVQRGGNRA